MAAGVPAVGAKQCAVLVCLKAKIGCSLGYW